MGVQAPSRVEALDEFAVWPECWPTVQLFASLHTLWRTGPLGGLQGLDYPGVEVVMRMERVKDKRETFADIRAMESAALEILNAK